MWGARVFMRKENNSLLRYRASALILALLLCLGVLSACGKKAAKTTIGNDSGNSGTSVTTSATPTPSPTPTVAFVKKTYETVGRDDLYRMPFKESVKGWNLMDAICAGDYALFRFEQWEEGDGIDPDSAAFKTMLILTKPCESDEQYSVTVDYLETEPHLLPDGMVILEERDTYRVHIFNNRLTEVMSFLPRGEVPTAIIGVSEDRIVWNADEGSSKLLGTDLYGQPAGEYSYDAKFDITRYLGAAGGQKCFLADEKDTTGYEYLFLPESGTEVTYLSENESMLGDEWQGVRIAPISELENTNSDSTWFFHVPGKLKETIAFPKAALKEDINFIQDNKLCSGFYRWIDRSTGVREIRLYDLDKRTVSDVLYDTDIPGCMYLSARGLVGGSNMILRSTSETGVEEVLIWAAGEKTTPITGFCDFRKDDPEESMKVLVKEAEEKYNIVITPDKLTNDGSLNYLGKAMAAMEFVNMFLLEAKTNSDVLKTESGKAIHPENLRTNDGAGYTFNPHVFSSYYLKEYGEARRDAFYRYVDALRAGEDEFDCGDEGNANWSAGRYSKYFFPIARLYVEVRYQGNGKASILYKIPKEEFLEKEKAFEERIMQIVNDVVEEDYTDFEKALALYEFMTEYCTYDYDMMEHNGQDGWTERQSAYRVLMERQGICWEIAALYRYLLLQCGVDSEESCGAPVTPGDFHEWNYIELDGQGYLIDATWGLTVNRAPDLKYFLFTDELRENRDGYDAKSFDIGGSGLYGARKKYSFDADDERYSELWGGTFVAFDEEEECIFYRDRDGALHRFDYGKDIPLRD